MKRQTKRKVKTVSFFNAPEVKKFMSNSKNKASIEAKSQYLYLLEAIERIRKKEGITQTQLSKRTHIGQDELSRIERGQKNITFETFFRIFNGLGYKPVIKFQKIHQKG